MKRPVAFFDIDGTLFRSSLLVELIEQLIKADIIPASVADEYAEAYHAWKNREGTYEDYIAAVVSAYITHIKGVFYGDVADIGREVVAKLGKHTYKYTRELVNELKAQNYYIVAISQSPKSILDDFCQQYGFDKVYGRIYEIGPQDHLTGLVTDEHLIANKANIVARVFNDDNLTKEGSVGVGDTEGDISLLESVERPICFNPNQSLYTYAKHMDWEVVVERKDVVYTVQ